MTPGTKLGPYDIFALIGVGGMGEAYRGCDTGGAVIACGDLPQVLVYRPSGNNAP
jgi:hypothetical protein